MRKPNGKLTLKDVAEKLGVSTATISNAYNRPDQLSAGLRAHILEQCEQLGYYGPNAAARSLRTGCTNIVGVMLSNYLSYSFSDPVAHQFLQGLAEVFEPLEYNLLVMPSRDHMKQVQGVESFVEGFIIYGPPEAHKLKQLVNQRKSIIAVDFRVEGAPSINIDNYTAAKECALHALKENTGPVAILGLRIIDADRVCRVDKDELYDTESIITIPRLEGFLDAAREVDVPITAERITHVPDNTHELGYKAAREALMCSPRPSVLLCMSDRIALAAIKAARDLNLRVPRDVRITGFDDIPESQNQHPSLTTVKQQSIDKGRIAAEMFLGVREEKDILLPTELIVRESCP